MAAFAVYTGNWNTMSNSIQFQIFMCTETKIQNILLCCWKQFMKAINIFFILLFIFSAALQYNDPDPYVWIPVYLYGAFLCYQSVRNRYRPVLFLAGLIIYSAYAVYLFFDKTGVWNWVSEHDSENIVQSMKATKPWIEETREFLGLLILIFSILMNMIWLRKKIKIKARRWIKMIMID